MAVEGGEDVIFEFDDGTAFVLYDAGADTFANRRYHNRFHAEVLRRKRNALSVTGRVRLSQPKNLSIPSDNPVKKSVPDPISSMQPTEENKNDMERHPKSMA